MEENQQNYHVNDYNEMGKCEAKERSCPFEHYSTEREAKIAVLTVEVQNAQDASDFDTYFIKRQELTNLQDNKAVISQDFLDSLVAADKGNQHISKKITTVEDVEVVKEAFARVLNESEDFNTYGLIGMLVDSEMYASVQEDLVSSLSPTQAELLLYPLTTYQTLKDMDAYDKRALLQSFIKKHGTNETIVSHVLHINEDVTKRNPHNRLFTVEEEYNMTRALPASSYPGIIFGIYNPEYALNTPETRQEFYADYNRLTNSIISNKGKDRDEVRKLAYIERSILNRQDAFLKDKGIGNLLVTSPVYNEDIQQSIMTSELATGDQALLAYENIVNNNIVELRRRKLFRNVAAPHLSKFSDRQRYIWQDIAEKHFEEITPDAKAPYQDIDEVLGSQEIAERAVLQKKATTHEQKRRLASLDAAYNSVEKHYNALLAEYETNRKQIRKLKRTKTEEGQKIKLDLTARQGELVNKILDAQNHWRSRAWLEDMRNKVMPFLP